jgi:DNA-binding response OmpR family regulator
MLLKKIVVAEDDDAIAHMVSMALGDAGFLCLRATDGEEALNMVRLHTPDLLVLDVMMPRMDGIEVARRIKGDVLLSRTPILMLTALSTVDNKLEGYEAGADAYMGKPFDLREFSAQAKALVRAAARERGRNPTTNLPGANYIETQIEQALSTGTDMAVVHFEVREFGTYTDEVGFGRAESLMASLGNLVLDKVRGQSPDQPFLGHLGGTDFAAVVPRERADALARDVIDSFDAVHGDWLVGGTSIDKLTMAVAVVPTTGLKRNDGSVLAERIAAALKAAKARTESSCVVWSPDLG